MHDVQEIRVFLSLCPIRRRADSLTLQPQSRIRDLGRQPCSTSVHNHLSIGADVFNKRVVSGWLGDLTLLSHPLA